MRIWLFIFSLLALPSFADDDFGYILYAHKDTKVGVFPFKEDDAILLRPKIRSPKNKGKSDFTAVVDFKKVEQGEPKGKWLSGRIDFSKWRRPQPLSQQDPNTWTTEPAHTLPPAELPKEVCPSGEEDCKSIAGLIYEFHNSDLCDEINRAAELVDSRTVQLLKAWNQFIKRKSKGRCHIGPPGKDAGCEQLKRARDVDILARTTVFESEPVSPRCRRTKRS